METRWLLLDPEEVVYNDVTASYERRLYYFQSNLNYARNRKTNYYKSIAESCYLQFTAAVSSTAIYFIKVAPRFKALMFALTLACLQRTSTFILKSALIFQAALL